MLQDALIQHCAPTLAGIKTGNLFSFPFPVSEIIDEIKYINVSLREKGLRLIPLRKKRKNTLIYLYRPEKLKEDLSAPEAVDILKKKGYSMRGADCMVAELSRHVSCDPEFPHEIGLFLGYPPSDVKCFLKSPCNGVRCAGCWKAYSNEKEAEEIFKKYKRCTRLYLSEMKKGKTLESLAV